MELLSLPRYSWPLYRSNAIAARPFNQLQRALYQNFITRSENKTLPNELNNKPTLKRNIFMDDVLKNGESVKFSRDFLLWPAYCLPIITYTQIALCLEMIE